MANFQKSNAPIVFCDPSKPHCIHKCANKHFSIFIQIIFTKENKRTFFIKRHL